MQQANHAPIRPIDVLRTIVVHPWRWALPLVGFTALALVFAALRPVSWEATQALLVRDEAVGNTVRPGRFTHVDEMKTVQETVLELVKSRSVLTGALVAIGPPADYAGPQGWPSDAAVEGLQQTIKLSPPKGAEFGKTEVFYLKVSAPDKQRAVELAAAVCRELEAHFEQLRISKYQSVIDEMTNTVALAQADLTCSTAALTAVEQKTGRDLAELRTLNESPSSDSALRRMASELETELRTYRALASSNQELLDLLEASKDNPGRLLASPSRLLDAQPALRRLKDGLVDAQLRTAALLGTMSPEHPAAQASKVGEQEIGAHLHEEMGIAIEGLQIDLRLARERVAAIEAQREELQDRLMQLANVRAEYGNLVIATRQRSDILKTAQQELSEAEAGQAAARTSSLITLIDHPDAGSRPSGPGRTTIVLGGLMAGLFVGMGIVFLTIQPSASPARVAGSPERRAAMQPSAITPQPAIVPQSTVIPQEAVIPQAAVAPRESVAKVPAASGSSTTSGVESIPAGSLSLKQALQKLGSPRSAWN